MQATLLVNFTRDCPTCGAKVGQFCIYIYNKSSKGSSMKDDVHMARKNT